MKNLFLVFVFTIWLCHGGDLEKRNLSSIDEKKNLFPLSTFEIIVTILVFFNTSLASSVGIGGGVFFVFFYMVFLDYNSSDAVALSHFTMIGGSLTVFLIKVFFRHPTRDKPLIEYDIIICIISPLLLGSMSGVLVNISLPYWTIVLIYTITLAYLCISTIKSGIAKLKKEREAEKKNEENIVPQLDLLINREEETLDADLEEIYNKEKKNLPFLKILIILAVYFMYIFLFLVRGSTKFNSIVGIEFCSYMFWIILGIIIIVLLLSALLCARIAKNSYEKKIKLNYNFDEFDIKWTKENAKLMIITGLISGFIGTLIGIGGAFILNPVLLRMKVRPDVMTATSSTMVFLVSSINGLQYLLAGKIELYFASWLTLFTFIGSALGIYCIKAIVDKYKRPSIIIFLLAAILIIGLIITPIYTLVRSLQSTNTNYGFHNYCSS